ncbi:hypothetical protein CC2G_008404 [Coprinopsis cinerea AmutBmut pab1-1]|nr:hypothetical protein CC2G_008404 [Coprinopsis cinerea AmutBmut pab1-1]
MENDVPVPALIDYNLHRALLQCSVDHVEVEQPVVSLPTNDNGIAADSTRNRVRFTIDPEPDTEEEYSNYRPEEGASSASIAYSGQSTGAMHVIPTTTSYNTNNGNTSTSETTLANPISVQVQSLGANLSSQSTNPASNYRHRVPRYPNTHFRCARCHKCIAIHGICNICNQIHVTERESKFVTKIPYDILEVIMINMNPAHLLKLAATCWHFRQAVALWLRNNTVRLITERGISNTSRLLHAVDRFKCIIAGPDMLGIWFPGLESKTGLHIFVPSSYRAQKEIQVILQDHGFTKDEIQQRLMDDNPYQAKAIYPEFGATVFGVEHWKNTGGLTCYLIMSKFADPLASLAELPNTMFMLGTDGKDAIMMYPRYTLRLEGVSNYDYFGHEVIDECTHYANHGFITWDHDTFSPELTRSPNPAHSTTPS